MPLVVETLSKLPEDATLVHGMAQGADSQCEEYWKFMSGRKTEEFPADWRNCAPECNSTHRKVNSRGQEYCPTAGHRRNQAMIDSGIELLVAFPGGTGTADCVKRAQKAGIPVLDAMTGERK